MSTWIAHHHPTFIQAYYSGKSVVVSLRDEAGTSVNLFFDPVEFNHFLEVLNSSIPAKDLPDANSPLPNRD